MKKIFLFITVLAMSIFMVGCSKNDPFKYFEKSKSACIKISMTETNSSGAIINYPIVTTYMQMYDEYTIEYSTFTINSIVYKSYEYHNNDDESKYILYEYDFQLNKWNKEIVYNEESDGSGEKLLDKNNYDYDKKEKKYNIKPTIDLGNYLSSSIYFDDEHRVMVHYKESSYEDNEQVLIEYYVRFSNWDEDFQLAENLPKVN